MHDNKLIQTNTNTRPACSLYLKKYIFPNIFLIFSIHQIYIMHVIQAGASVSRSVIRKNFLKNKFTIIEYSKLISMSAGRTSKRYFILLFPFINYLS